LPACASVSKKRLPEPSIRHAGTGFVCAPCMLVVRCSTHDALVSRNCTHEVDQAGVCALKGGNAALNHECWRQHGLSLRSTYDTFQRGGCTEVSALLCLARCQVMCHAVRRGCCSCCDRNCMSCCSATPVEQTASERGCTSTGIFMLLCGCCYQIRCTYFIIDFRVAHCGVSMLV
jgi:hypothetical protein